MNKFYNPKLNKFAITTIFSLFFSFYIYPQNLNLTNEGPKKFEYKYRENDSYRILSTVEEDAYFNNYKNHSTKIINRISVKVTNVDNEKMTGLHTGTFMTTENSVLANSQNNKTLSYGEEYKSVFTRDKFGVYTIDDIYFMPTVRDIPVFPDKELSPGDKWSYEGHEAHDFRRSFGLQKPYKIPFTANYEYLGTQNKDGTKLEVFQVYYELSFSINQTSLYKGTGESPHTITGFSSQIIFWDIEKGGIDNYFEQFQIIIKTTHNNTYSFIGNAKAEVTEFQRTATVENVNEVSKKISDLGIQDVEVKTTEKGLTLSIENIQFLADSDILLESEKNKLVKIAKILEAYPNNDLLITGHTALRGTKESRQQLSEQRASAVAQFLISLGVKDVYNIFTQGKGGDEPIATNNTEEGRKKNRRVEITIMD